jgi:hypothetical protein
LDPRSLAENLLKTGQVLVGTRYFTAPISTADPGKRQRQGLYLEAIGTVPETRMHYGHYLPTSQKCRRCGVSWIVHEEKMTDVNIAVEMLKDAFDDAFDTALLVSADGDLAPVVETIRVRFPGKRVVVACPPARQSRHLASVAHAYFRIGRKIIQDSQFADAIVKQGLALTRPPSWR